MSPRPSGLNDSRRGLQQIGSGTDPANCSIAVPRLPARILTHAGKPRLPGHHAQLRFQGPVGVPLEDLENSRYASSIKWTKVNGSQVEVVDAITSAKVAKRRTNRNDSSTPKETWHFVGIDVQYFAALCFPHPNRSSRPSTRHRGVTLPRPPPKLVHRNSKNPCTPRPGSAVFPTTSRSPPARRSRTATRSTRVRSVPSC
ncbi:MAG: hypothetical protein Ct9H300mP1_38850 [Planctomycetaceae bacterium]|nr:MAG: hypothetical protein Ct9H300mP1_38850 [Planctomycetaceae bacterium]